MIDFERHRFRCKLTQFSFGFLFQLLCVLSFYGVAHSSFDDTVRYARINTPLYLHSIINILYIYKCLNLGKNSFVFNM